MTTAPRGQLAGTGGLVYVRLTVDLLLAATFLSLMSVPLTGLPLHEVLGISILCVVLVHLLLQWGWIVATTARSLRLCTARLRFTYVLNISLFLCTVLALVSGLAIANIGYPLALPSLISDSLQERLLWRALHTLSSNVLLLLAGVHLGLNWRWVVFAWGRVTTPAAPGGESTEVGDARI